MPDEAAAAGIRERIAQVRNDRDTAQAAGEHAKAVRLDEQERELWAELDPGPVVGSQMRTY